MIKGVDASAPPGTETCAGAATAFGRPRRAGRGWLGALAAVLAVVLVTALPARAQPSGEPLDVVATTGMLGDAIKAVGGERVSVTTLMGPGVDPHTYRQTRSDIGRLTRADLVVWHGLNLEAQLEKLMHDLARRQRVVALAETALPRADLLADEDYPDRYDPHVWMDPSLWERVVEAARDALIDAEPASRAVFEANARAYLLKLDELDDYSRKVLESVPPKGRVLVTAHDAFRYFGRAYGYEVLGIQGISTESEASLHQVERLVGELAKRQIGAIFVESSVSERNVRALVEGAAARGHTVRVGGELYSDAMGAPDTPEGTYLGMIAHNVSTIACALGGDAGQPPAGVAPCKK